MAEAKWYVVHTYSGHENKVKANIEKIIENRAMEDTIFDIAIPTEEIIEERNGKQKIKSRKIYPGYVIVKMIMTDESWYVIRNTRGVTGFIGPVGSASRPIELSDEEVEIMGLEKNKDSKNITIELKLEKGDIVKVVSGIYSGKEAKVIDVYPNTSTIKVSIEMFGRETPIEIAYNEIEKIN